jgi:hypothetical protein
VSRSGVYVFRCRRPGLLGRIPLLGRHTAYVGEGWVDLRRKEHLAGGGRYRRPAKPWSDLRPSIHVIRLPYWKWLLRSVETLLILLLWPVYNVSKNRWNPRRIPPGVAEFQRRMRDRIGWSFNFRLAHAMLWIVGGILLWNYLLH